MKVLEVDPVRVGDSMESAFDLIWSERTLRDFHGPTLSVTPWTKRDADNATRKLRFRIDVGDAPNEVARILASACGGGREMWITTRQTLSKHSADRWHVVNKIRMHFLGAELFKVKPTFVLERSSQEEKEKDKDGGVYLSGRISHHAVLPPIVCGIVEEFMKQRSKLEVESFAGFLSGKK